MRFLKTGTAEMTRYEVSVRDMEKAQRLYNDMVKAFGTDSNQAKSAYADLIGAQTDHAELMREIERIVRTGSSRMTEYEQNLESATEAMMDYDRAVRVFGEGSLEASSALKSLNDELRALSEHTFQQMFGEALRGFEEIEEILESMRRTRGFGAAFADVAPLMQYMDLIQGIIREQEQWGTLGLIRSIRR